MPRDTLAGAPKTRESDLGLLIQTASALYMFERFDAARDILALAHHLFPDAARPLELSALIALRCNSLEEVRELLLDLSTLRGADAGTLARISAELARRE